MLTEKFARTNGTDVFLTGVAYDDTDGDAFYSVGEAVAGLSFGVGAQSVLSAAAGGYQLALAPSTDTEVRDHGWRVRRGGEDRHCGGNAKLDVVDGPGCWPRPT
jgi:hypothetical protein